MQMEPMALGSPPSSPGSPPVNPNFLPAFLMGERQAQTPNRSANLSPTKNRSFGYKSPASTSEQRTLHPKMFNNIPSENSPFNMSNAEKTGPPALGLFDTLETNDFAHSSRIDTLTSPTRDPLPNRYPDTPNSLYIGNVNDTVDGTPTKGFQHNVSLQKNLNDSLSKTHPFRKQVEKNDELWITVLGFPPHAASLVVSHFAQFGTITEKKFPPEGNWINLKYSAPHEVARALSYNGKLISNTIMVGVIPKHKPSNPKIIHFEDKENNTVCNDATSTSVITSPNRARSLTQPYTLPRNTEVLSPQNVPQRSTGLVTKAMEYVFGW